MIDTSHSDRVILFPNPYRIIGEVPRTRVISVTSGKGGVGKTNIVANVGLFMSQMGRKVVILDADMGLGNIDLLLGVSAPFNLSHVIRGEKTLAEVALPLSERLWILPAASGVAELAHLNGDQRHRLISDLDDLIDGMDILLVDTAAGISSNVIYFNQAAQEVIVVVTPEPTAITDAYALMKVLAMKHGLRRFQLLVNCATSLREAEDIFQQLAHVTRQFLGVTLTCLGHVLYDESVKRAVRNRKPLVEASPDSRAARCCAALARKIANMPPAATDPTAQDTPWKHFRVD